MGENGSKVDSGTDPSVVELDTVRELVRSADPTGERFAKVFRETFYQIYNGQKTGHYCYDQLTKTEKTHFGTLIEIAVRKEFDDIIDDGQQHHLDYRIANVDVDCKFSMRKAGWMIPVEAENEIIIGLHASDEDSCFSVCVERMLVEKLSKGGNRDRKRTLTKAARQEIQWIFDDAELPVNRLLHLPDEDREAIFAQRSGQKRVNELFRRALGLVINREDIATVAQQSDYMKRIRGNGGARSALRGEGIVILTGGYRTQREIAKKLTGQHLRSTELLALRLVRAEVPGDSPAVRIQNDWWRVARPDEEIVEAPVIG